ncbi:Ohr subfamily peroxiredoxin [Skermanella aerolata]|jgi:Ohr subfamily peroxiredoxin|uniref:Organic hydroperoxide resistance protein n=1 Tax=Skermanella aerolata TaxID=393310 RepID=A0A512DXN5_9PROT|nr:organic hydroperoxide resistance protein [Skermanella aerolata]KJB92262.1 Organic hydroperoxide resistance protein [Skermanella aerolata KACC 11604]GEO41237.1 organic hydroperoxide resistance protein [Skermanella aerolata]
MPVDVKYTAEATATGGRDGRASTTDGTFDVKLATPKELGGAGGEGNNPEQLFAAGYAACFIGALKAAGAQEKVKIPADTSITANVGIGPRSEGGFGLDVALRISLPGMDKAQAEAIVDKAHHICPYSNATRGNVDVRLTVV